MPDGEATNDEAVRDRVLRTLLHWFCSTTAINGVVMFLHASQHDGAEPSLLAGIVGLQAVLLLPWLRTRLGYRTTAMLTLAHLLTACTYFQLFRGLTPGTVLGTVAFLLVSGLFFGARGIRWAFALSFASLIFSSAFILTETIEPWGPWFWDPREPLVWVRYALVFVGYGGGVAAGLVLTIQGLEDSAARLRETLERERRERVQLEIVQRELEKSKRLEALAQFAAGVAHDFNNNLSVITGSASLIQAESNAPPNVRALAEDITQSAQLGAVTVRQLLSLGRTDSGEPELVELHDLLRRSLSTLRQAVGPQVELMLDGDTSGGVFVDGGRLRQALLNLAINARDAMPEGGRWRLRVTERDVAHVPVSWSARPGRFLTLECCDDGVGMQPELLDKIFEPFFSTKAAQAGSGLGLAMVRKTVHEAQGFIEVESSPGAGTTFRLNLPRRAS
ncbi:MAG TPA: ATP-binding protein [Polyangiales bacterium]|nr:ATP-binding protein [Polyangiales bacterium]